MLDSRADLSSDLPERKAPLISTCSGILIPSQRLTNYCYQRRVAREVHDVSAPLGPRRDSIVHSLQPARVLPDPGTPVKKAKKRLPSYRASSINSTRRAAASLRLDASACAIALTSCPAKMLVAASTMLGTG